MTDDHLRALERRFRETGSVEDEAAWIRQQVRTGLISPAERRQQFAAWLGHKESIESLPEPPADYFADLLWWEDQGHRRAPVYLELYGEEALTRLLVSTLRARPTVQKLDKQGPRRRTLEAVESLIIRPEDTGLREHLGSALESRKPGAGERDSKISRFMVDLLWRTVEFVLHGDPHTLSSVWRSAKGLDQGTPDEVRTDLVPWALGMGDPVRDRVEARQREAAGG